MYVLVLSYTHTQENIYAYKLHVPARQHAHKNRKEKKAIEKLRYAHTLSLYFIIIFFVPLRLVAVVFFLV